LTGQRAASIFQEILKSQTPDHHAAVDAELEVADTIGRMMQFWGFKRPMGRVWTLLYLSPEPMAAVDLGERLRMSAGAVSMTLSELTKWGAIKKTWRPGERREYYEAETSIWKLVRRVLEGRELSLVREFSETLERADRALDSAEPGTERADFKKARVKQLFELSKLGENLLSALVQGQSVDPAPIREASK
jgi:DNA-binding transcriptional regulator GbsR (MarR family)